MHSPTPARSGAKLSHRSPWPYLVLAVVLLGISQLLWLWHSWPVREVLDADQIATGAST